MDLFFETMIDIAFEGYIAKYANVWGGSVFPKSDRHFMCYIDYYPEKRAKSVLNSFTDSRYVGMLFHLKLFNPYLHFEGIETTLKVKDFHKRVVHALSNNKTKTIKNHAKKGILETSVRQLGRRGFSRTVEASAALN